MPGFQLTQAAKADLKNIGRYAMNRWGRAQRDKYLEMLDGCFHDFRLRIRLATVTKFVMPNYDILAVSLERRTLVGNAGHANCRPSASRSTAKPVAIRH